MRAGLHRRCDVHVVDMATLKSMVMVVGGIVVKNTRFESIYKTDNISTRKRIVYCSYWWQKCGALKSEVKKIAGPSKT